MENEVTKGSEAGTGKKKTEVIVGKVKAFLGSKKTVTVLTIILIAGAAFYFKDLVIVASVDGKLISRFQVIGELEKQSGEAAVDGLITDKLIENEAKKQGVLVSEDEVREEIASIEVSISEQGLTLDEVLLGQGLDRQSFEKSIRIQKTLAHLLGDKGKVTEEEIDQYLEANKGMLPPTEESELRQQVSDQLANQKLGQEASKYVEGLKAAANIRYYKKY